MTGCKGISGPGENQARANFASVEQRYRPENRVARALPQLNASSSLSNFVACAVLNSPSAEAAFYDWAGSVENITVTRSQADPQLTFQAYIVHTLTSLMPGLAWSFPGPGKLKVRANVAVAESQDKYFTFETAVLQAADDLERAYFQLGLLDEQLQLKREMLSLLQSQEQAVSAQNTSGGSRLAELLRLQSELDRAKSELANLEDSRPSLLAHFKAALGLGPDQPDPPLPAHFESSKVNLDSSELLREALARNPQLKTMEADVRAAEAGIAVAYKERVPNFTAGLQAEVYSPPFYWPQASMTLPLWRDKLAAEMAQAQAGEVAARSRLKAAQIDLAVSFAEKLFTYRQTTRNISLINDQLLPQAQRTLQTIEAAYQSGGMDFSSLTEAEAALITLKLEAAQNQTDREIALADLSLLVLGAAPPHSPLLSLNPQY